MVAKTYQKYTQIGEPFQSAGKWYVNLISPKGLKKIARWYTEAEYAKMYPETQKQEEVKQTKTQKEVLLFDKGYIYIFKGDCTEWCRAIGARYTRIWGWYTNRLPDYIPEGITAIKLNWDKVGGPEGKLKNETAVREAVESVLYGESNSTYQGDIGERIERSLTVISSRTGASAYGSYTIHVFEDELGNHYSWTTGSKTWKKGEQKHIRATVKEHKMVKGACTTVLTRCTEVK